MKSLLDEDAPQRTTEASPVISEPLLADSFERSRALDPAVSFHLEAPAGSGKTFLLTARFLRLLGMVDHPQQILALTFTNKAAGEMQERVGKYLRRAASNQPSENALDAELLASAQKALERHDKRRDLILSGELLRIQTYHSFCYALVSQAPLEAGIIPGASLLVEPDQIYFLREAIDRTLLQIMEQPPESPQRSALENRLLYLNNSWPMLSAELEDLMQRREALVDLIGILDRQRTVDYVSRSIRELVETELGALESSFKSVSLAHFWTDFLADLHRNGAALAAKLPPVVPRHAWEELPQWMAITEALLTKEGKPRKQFGPASGFYSGFKKTEWGASIESLASTAVDRLHRIRELPGIDAASPDFETLWDLILLLNAVMQAYEDRCRSRRLLDFSTLETAALRLFSSSEPSDLQLLLDHQIRHVLIDEFQDTSYRQWELLQRLFAGWSSEEGRTLFVVGDPKQSIYGFRKAEVRLFLEALNGLPLDGFRKLPLEPLALSTNFRSEPHLIEWCNDLFHRTVMADPKADLDEVPFKSSSASPKFISGSFTPAIPELFLFISRPDALTARRREADWLARHIHEARNSHGGDFEAGILLFTRTHLPIYLDALQRYGVSVQVSEGLKLLERPEVQYLWQLCRALVLPHDDLAWASQLRSPWLSLNYREIYSLSLEEPAPWVEKIRTFAQKDERIAQFWEDLKGVRRRLGHEPLANVMEDAWIALGGARSAAKRWGSRGLASSRRFFDLVREAEVHEPIQTLMRLDQLLEHAYEPVDPESALSKISLMTIHKAKGLEFDSVYLPFTDWSPTLRERSNQPPYLLERLPGSSERHLLAARPDRRRGEPDPVYRWLHNLHIDRRWGEAKRLFYVAVTRARSKLYMSGLLPWRGNAGSPVFPAQTPLTWLNDHYSIADSLDIKSFTMDGEESNLDECLSRWEKSLKTKDLDFQINVEPKAAAVSFSSPEEAPEILVRPAPFERERPFFQVRSPSAFTPMETSSSSRHKTASADSALWGALIHKLLESYGKHGILPSIEEICGYLIREGVEEEEALETARRSIVEVDRCIADPWLAGLYDLPEEQRCIEHPLEAWHSSRALYSGVIDLAAHDGEKWLLIDFKTSAPSSDDENLEEFFREEMEKYAPQLQAYREMWAKARMLNENEIDAVIYWTALRHWESYRTSERPVGAPGSPA